MLPFSFREHLRHAGVEPLKPPEHFTKSVRSGVEKRLREYLATGGFPEAQELSARDRMELLRGYVDTALIRRRDGRTFAVTPVRSTRSPLDVPGIDTGVTTPEILECIREGRERGDRLAERTS